MITKNKILIITLNDNNNYGNRLQNFALQDTLNKIGFTVETLNDFKPSKKTIKLKKRLKYTSIKGFFRAISYKKDVFLKKVCQKKYIKIIKTRLNNFILFNKKMLIQRKETDIMQELKKEYNYFMIGSDQIWNYTNFKNVDYTFCQFANSDKIVAYAPSFGLNSIHRIWKKCYINGLSHINNISVREDAGAKIIKDLIGRDVPVLVDPTMLLTAEEWRKIEIQPENAKNKKYLLTYFLGKISKKRKAFFDKIAKENNLEIINMVQITEPETYVAGPSEFLSYIDNASVVFTDSFHACVFSILFKTPFYVLDREDNSQNMNSRLDTLLGKFKLEDRKLNSYSDEVSLKVDYSHTDEILEQERKKSDEFLRKALNIK